MVGGLPDRRAPDPPAAGAPPAPGLSAGHRRQRSLYDRLWRDPRARALSPDLVRFRVWGPYLRPPVVDVGAGDALLARSFPGLGVVSVDLSAAGLGGAGGPAAVGAAEALPVGDGAVATVVLSEVLEHAARPADVLGECRRVLAPDGRLLLSTPLWPLSRAAHLYFWARTRQRPSPANLHVWDPQHERRYRLADLLDEVAGAGFRVERTVPLFGSASSLALYVVEPGVARVTGRSPRLAHLAVGVDRMIAPLDHPSAVALVCRPA